MLTEIASPRGEHGDRSPEEYEEMERDMSQALVDHPGPEQLQAEVDAAEAMTTVRYRRLQDYMCLLGDALRHADAMRRLELSLQLAQVI